MMTTIETWDCRNGGSYKYTHERDAKRYSFFGVFHEVLTPERTFWTFEFDGLPERGHMILGATVFEELADSCEINSAYHGR